MATLINRKMYWCVGGEVLAVTVTSEDIFGVKCLVLTENDSKYVARTAQLHPYFPADEITVVCAGCGDEYTLLVSKTDDRMIRGHGCNCGIDEKAESVAIEEFYEPKPKHWARQYQDDAGGIL